MANVDLILRPHNGEIWDVFLFLFFSRRKHGFIEYPEHLRRQVDTFNTRWIIAVSMLIMKFLHLVAKPMALVGDCVEFILNLLSNNGGIRGIIFRVLTGSMIIPETNSETFTSAVGHLDPRLDLNKGEINSLAHHVAMNGDYNIGKTTLIQVGSRYCADLCMMASKLAYENESFIRNVVTKHWKMHFVEFFNCPNSSLAKNTTKAFIFCDKPVYAKLVVVAFRGTDPFNAGDWSTDFDVSLKEMCTNGRRIGRVHRGFLKAMGWTEMGGADCTNEEIIKTHLEPNRTNLNHDHDNAGMTDEYATEDEKQALAYYVIRRKLSRLLEEHKDAKFIVTGHSLGGAMAILFPALLILDQKTELMERLLAVYTFGKPRIGDGEFAAFMNKKLNEPVTRYFRVVYCNDMVPRVPYDDNVFLFKHFGVCLYYNSRYKEQTVEEEPNRNFSISYFIPNRINAMWELVHSVTMGYTRGEDFKEGWFSLLSRYMGIFLPGISAHSPVNYVNANRLSPVLFHTEPKRWTWIGTLDGQKVKLNY